MTGRQSVGRTTPKLVDKDERSRKVDLDWRARKWNRLRAEPCCWWKIYIMQMMVAPSCGNFINERIMRGYIMRSPTPTNLLMASIKSGSPACVFVPLFHSTRQLITNQCPSPLDSFHSNPLAAAHCLSRHNKLTKFSEEIRNWGSVRRDLSLELIWQLLGRN